MKRWALLTITLTLISTLSLAQAVVTPSGQATTQGAAIPQAQPVSPLLITTPLIHLGTASTLPGSTGAVGVPQPPSTTPIRAEVDLGQAAVYTGAAAVAPAEDMSAANSENNGAGVTTVRHRIDTGVHSSDAIAFSDGLNGRSLGEIARENRQRMQNANARTFTNADVAKAANSGGMAGAATSAANASYPGDNGVINSNGVAVDNSSQAGVAAPQPGATPGQANVPPATEQKPSAAGSVPPQSAQAQTPANPADQNAAANNAANQSEQRTLPKSGSFLPLVAVVGIAATAAGLLSRK